MNHLIFLKLDVERVFPMQRRPERLGETGAYFRNVLLFESG